MNPCNSDSDRLCGIMQKTPLILAAAIFVAAMICADSSVSAETVWLSSLDLTRMTSGWSIPRADLGIAGQPLSIGGKQFAQGLGTHAESKLRVHLGRKASRFFAHVGVDDS